MIRRISGLLACAAVLAVATPRHADAQFGKLKDKIKQRIDQKVDQKMDCALDEVFKDGKCAKKSDNNGAGGSAGGAYDGASAATKSSGKAASLKPGDGAWANYDFVPGDKILFAEDFTVDRVGNFPKRLELEKGAMEVVEWQGRRWLRSTTASEFTVKLPQALPERWTMEFEITVPWSGMWIYPGEQVDQNANATGLQKIFLSNSVEVGVDRKIAATELQQLFGEDIFPGQSSAATDSWITTPLHVRVQADGNYMKVYIEEKRVANMPNMGRWQGNKLHFYFRDNTVNDQPNYPLITNLTINAGGKEMYDKLMANGRLAVQGIYFDVGSDRIRPESSGTLTEISEMLKEHADLKLTVEGHTDNVGAPDKNKTLSDARAAAVVSYLASKGIDAARLKSIGYGDSKPAAPNDTPENRQKNRRVELVKM